MDILNMGNEKENKEKVKVSLFIGENIVDSFNLDKSKVESFRQLWNDKKSISVNSNDGISKGYNLSSYTSFKIENIGE